jgi:hypothetical protein
MIFTHSSSNPIAMTTRLSRSIRRGSLRALLLVPALALSAGCTDLTEIPQDALTPENAFRTEEEILAGVASVYARLRSSMWGFYNLSEITTDEMIVPTRGSDWFDNGRWLEIYRQTWTANSGSALDDMNGTWNDMFSGVARANLMISVIEQAGGAEAERTIAELRTLRAWYYYILMDLFGGVPLVTSTELGQFPRATRAEVFQFIETELLESRDQLPETWPADQYGRVTKGAANAILASLYLNAQVYTGTVTAAGLQPGQARWQDAIDAANEVINSGVYTLEPDWRDNFDLDNENSKENIFVVVHSSVAGLGMSLPMRTLHYNQLTPGPWNGFASLAETYNAFDPADERRDMFLVGQQYSFNTGAPVNDRAGNPLVFTTTIGNPTAAAENEGARFNKFPPLPGAVNGDSHPNDFPYFRLAEMYLIRAEAENELGQTGAAIADINIVRERAFEPDKPLSAGLSQDQVRAAVLNERLFEFNAEGKRRRDLIRFGKFTDARAFKTATEGYRILFPIPQTQLQTNPLLEQNPGY